MQRAVSAHKLVTMLLHTRDYKDNTYVQYKDVDNELKNFKTFPA